ncbi:hypothetical protein NMM52_21380, partial [Acinetobacter baumannii]|nr:hypothetical protein [Acinetobacter baumannii]
MRQNRAKPRARADGDEVGVGKRGDSLRICFGVLRKDPYSSDLTRSRCHRDLPADGPHNSRIVIQSGNLSFDIERLINHGKHSTVGLSEHRYRVQSGLIIAENIGKPGNEQITHRMTGHGPVTAESMLESLRP